MRVGSLLPLSLLVSSLLCRCVALNHTVALLLPDPQRNTHLQLQTDGLRWLAQLSGPLTVVSVIGQYRSGKSFLLNQLAEVGCTDGFVVGHKRSTQTKGVWATVRSSEGGSQLFLDTEGFDATGKAAVYDDRIFSFAVLVSTIVIYNLVETIKEADIEKLAFAAQLAREFWRRADDRPTSADLDARPARGRGALGPRHGVGNVGIDGSASVATTHRSWTPPALLWLVQRDFLEGSSVDDHVRAALQPVAAVDEHGVRLNQIRAGLSQFGAVGGLGLVQPHVRRTALCELQASELSSEYSAGVARVREWLRSHSGDAGRRGGGRSGAALAAQVEKLVGVLNAQEIPNAGSVIDAFNREASAKARARFATELRELRLPMPTVDLNTEAASMLTAVTTELRQQIFGDFVAGRDAFDAGARDALRAANDANFRASHTLCESLWKTCSSSIAQLQHSTLPSRRRYLSRLAVCNSTLATCVGPAADGYAEQFAALASSGATAYGREFFSRVSHLFTLGCVLSILTFRYVFVSVPLEILSWLALVSVELLPRAAALTQLSSDAPSFWESPAGTKLLEAYEVAVFNKYADADDWVYVLPAIVIGACLVRRVQMCRRRCCRRSRDASSSGARRRLVSRNDDEGSADWTDDEL